MKLLVWFSFQFNILEGLGNSKRMNHSFRMKLYSKLYGYPSNQINRSSNGTYLLLEWKHHTAAKQKFHLKCHFTKSLSGCQLGYDLQPQKKRRTAFYSSGFIFFLLVSDTLIKDWRSRHIFMVYDLQFCVHNILVLLYDFSSILNPIFEASIIKSQIFITQFLKTSLCNLDSPARSDKGANV